MSVDISLFDLVNLSIGTPEPGSVQFNALHTLLHAVIKHLNIQDVRTEWFIERHPSRDFPAPLDAQAVPRDMPSPYHHMEGKLRDIERQISALERLPSGTDLLSRRASGTANPVGDMWQFMQLRRKVQANEDGVSKCMGLIQDLMKEIQGLEESRDNLKKEVKTLSNQLNKLAKSDVSDRVTALEQCCQLVEDVEKNMRVLRERMAQYPDPEEMTQFVTWEVMQQTLIGERQSTMRSIQPFQPFLTRRTSSAHALRDFQQVVAMGNQPALNPDLMPDALQVPATGPALGTATSDPTLTAGPPIVSVPSDHAGVDGPMGGPAPMGSDIACLGSEGSSSVADTACSTGGPSGDTTAPADDTHTHTAPPTAAEDDQAGPSVAPTPSIAPAPASVVPPRVPGTAGSISPHATLAHGAPCLLEAGSGGAGQGLDPHQSASYGVLVDLGVPLSRVSSGALGYPETLRALQAIGGLGDRLSSLEARVATLEEIKADQAQLDELREAVVVMGEKDLPESQLMDEMSHLRDLVDTLMGDKEKHMEFNVVLSDTLSGDADEHQLSEQLDHLRHTVKKVEEELQQVKKDGTSQGQKRIEASLQEQLNRMRSMLEDMISSSSSMLARSLSEDPGPEPAQSRGPEQGQVEGQRQVEGHGPGHQGATCPSCSLDLSRKVSQLFQRYERLQGLIHSLSRQPHRQHNQQGGARVNLEPINLQDTEMINDVQGAILQLQSECEKLHRTTNHLMEEHGQKQTHIDHLYKSVEVLDEKKADRHLVEMEIQIKADKRALESKVSRLQFDAMTEQLNGMFQELLSKISLQEQDWNKVVDKISMEMECKLNRIELDPLKKQLEDRWRSIREKLQDQPAPEQNDAAGIRKQLVARFHCISCDRPVDMMTPGPNICPLPSTPGLHVHKSNRPYTVYELEQIRQHCRSLRPGTNQSHFEMVCVERSLAQVQRLHTHLCQQLEHAQSQLASPASRYHNTLTPLPRTWTTHTPASKVDRTADVVDDGGFTISRSCGGSHTLTYPHRRHTRLQNITHLIHTQDEESCSPLRIQPEEVDILGLDGHIYKGRLNTLSGRPVKSLDQRLPVIISKEGKGNVKQKLTVLPKNGGDVGRVTPVRPQSAKTQRSRSASNGTVKDRPLSSIGCVSRDADQSQRTLQLTVDLTQEDEPVTSL